MKKSFIIIVFSILSNSLFSQVDINQAGEIIKGIIGIGNAIEHDVRVKKSKEQLEQWKREGRPDANCWYIDSNGDLRQEKTQCYINGVDYGYMDCSVCIKMKEDIRKKEEMELSFVDLGLPSGTLWKDKNESGGFYTYEQAMNKFRKNLPTKEQLEELKNSCQWSWIGNGYKVIGPNGNSIVLPAAGYRYQGIFDETVLHVGTIGSYWSSTPSSTYSWELSFFKEGGVYVGTQVRSDGRSVRLVR